MILFIFSNISFATASLILKENEFTRRLPISHELISIAAGPGIFYNEQGCVFKNSKFIKYMAALQPGYFRFGGTRLVVQLSLALMSFIRADLMTFLPTSKPKSVCNLSRWSKELGKPFAPVFLYKEDVQSLIDFSKKTSKRMLFGLNLNARHEDGSWNSTNIELLLDFFRQQNFSPDFELGNEPNSYSHHFNYTMTPEQQASDFEKLHKILHQKGFQSSKLIGPSTTGRGPTALSYFSRFLKEQPPIDFAAYHHYTLNGHIATVNDFLNPSSFYAYGNESKIWTKTATNFKTRPFISEGALAYGGGANNISDRFVSSFLWADKLAMSALTGIRAFCRETAFGGAYALLNSKLHPTPSYWVSFYFRQFFSGHILSMQTVNKPDAFHRIYNFCSKDNK